MSFLQKIKTVKADRTPVVVDPVQASREKLAGSIDEQLACIAALLANKPTPTKTVIKYRDGADGTRERYEDQMKIRPWFWGDGSKWFLEPRYANKALLVLAGLSNAVTFTKPEQMTDWLEKFKAAVLDGELDEAIAKAKVRRKAK